MISFSQGTVIQQERGSNNVAKAILEVAQMVNQAVGDALSCLLFVEVALLRQQWSLQQWADLYTDLPSCMLKVMFCGQLVSGRV